MQRQRGLARRLLRSTAAVLAVGLALVGCGSGDGGGDDGGTRTITLWHYYGPPESATGAALVRLLDKYEASHPGIKVEPRHIPFGDFNRTLLQGASGGDLPDIALINAFSTQSMAEAGVIEDLTDRVNAWGKKDGFFPTSWETTQYDGKTYGLPHLADAYAVYYNTDLLAAAKVANPPQTWTELAQVAAKLTSGDRHGLAVSGIEGDEGATGLILRMLAAGGDPAKIDSPAGRTALADMKALVDGGAMSKGVLTWNEEDVKNQFASGQAAMMINSATYVSVLRSEKPDLKWKVALLPTDQSRKTYLSAENLAITTGAKNPDAAWDLMTWMQQPDVLAEYLPDRNKLPARSDVPAGDDEVRAVFLQSLQDAWAPEGALAPVASEVFTHLQGALQAVLSGSASIDAAAAEAQQKIDKSLAG